MKLSYFINESADLFWTKDLPDNIADYAEDDPDSNYYVGIYVNPSTIGNFQNAIRLNVREHGGDDYLRGIIDARGNIYGSVSMRDEEPNSEPVEHEDLFRFLTKQGKIKRGEGVAIFFKKNNSIVVAEESIGKNIDCIHKAVKKNPGWKFYIGEEPNWEKGWYGKEVRVK